MILIKDKIIKEEVKPIKDFKVVDLNYNNALQEYEFLQEVLRQFIENKLKENDIKTDEEIKPFYSLTYCQGDGVMFEGVFKFKGCTFYVKHSGRYYHYNSKEIVGETAEGEETTAEQDEEFNEVYVDICREAEKQGYKFIEQDDENNILLIGYRDFLKENNILSDIELWDIEYKTEETKGYIKICNDGDTSIKGLWIKPFKIRTTIKEELYKVEYKEVV